MAKSEEAIVASSLLRWGRESARLPLEEAAKKIGVDVDKLAAWEDGTARPTVVQLRKTASVYKRPLAIFFLPEPPTDFQPIQDFRRLPTGGPAQISPDLAFELRRAQEARVAALELYEMSGEEVPRDWAKVPSLPQDADAAGGVARDVLAVNLPMQRAWRKPNDALRGWIRAVEASGVLVLQMSEIPIGEARGFSVHEQTLPVIVLNGADSPRGRIFTLLHEFAHVLHRSSGLCDLHDATSQADTEVYCNAVAAAALMPREALLAHPVVARVPANHAEWSRDEIRALATEFAASEEAVARRLLSLGKASRAFYRGLREALQAENEDARRRQKDAKGGPAYWQVQLRNLGAAYSDLAFRAYDRRAITLAELSSYMGVKVRHLGPMRAVVRGREA